MKQIKITLPDNFLNEEERNGYRISKEMKEVWAIELDLLAEFDRVCKKYNLVYFVAGGTMLGAVRHKGFIPWDDDIDVMMMRDQYDQLLKVASHEFKEPYFFQTSFTDRGSFNGHAKLRNSETTAILYPREYFEEMKINQGIFLDIFPADNLIEDEQKYDRQKKNAQLYKKIADNVNACTVKGYKKSIFPVLKFVRKSLSRTMNPILERIALSFYKKHEKECQRYNDVNTNCFSFLTYQFNHRWDGYKSDYNNFQLMDFEFMKVPVCEGYEHALSLIYGDWKKFVKGGAKHTISQWDTNKSYKEYLK